jgi:hypothetical protein
MTEESGISQLRQAQIHGMKGGGRGHGSVVEPPVVEIRQGPGIAPLLPPDQGAEPIPAPRAPQATPDLRVDGAGPLIARSRPGT